MESEEALIKSALEGNKESLETLINSVQKQVFNLSLRFLWAREDAEDATQEILIKLITNLSKFKGHSKFSTWAYRVATNYLLNLKATKVEKTVTSFDDFAADLASGDQQQSYNQPDRQIMEKEMKTGCTLAMLQCMDRNHRVTFILGSILKINSATGAEITATSPANFRKRLELSRKTLGNFLNQNCGVYNPENPCRCNKRINGALSCGRVNRKRLNFVGSEALEAYNEEMEELGSLKGIYQNHGSFKSKSDLTRSITQLISSKGIFGYD